MKKLMMAAAIVCAAVAAQAATVNWSDEKAIYDGTLTTTKIDGNTAYLIQVAVGQTASDLVSSFEAGTLTEATVSATGFALDSLSVDNGELAKVGGSTSALTAGTAEQAYFVIFNGDNMFVSDVINAQYDGTTTTYSFFFDTAKADSKALPVTTEYAGAGWYAAAAPEPTSGLLLLLGVAGLALRRRRA